MSINLGCVSVGVCFDFVSGKWVICVERRERGDGENSGSLNKVDFCNINIFQKIIPNRYSNSC